MSIGTGIAITGIWIGVGITSFSVGSSITGVAFCAAIATIFVGGFGAMCESNKCEKS